jgi:hypothetical protein
MLDSLQRVAAITNLHILLGSGSVECVHLLCDESCQSYPISDGFFTLYLLWRIRYRRRYYPNRVT